MGLCVIPSTASRFQNDHGALAPKARIHANSNSRAVAHCSAGISCSRGPLGVLVYRVVMGGMGDTYVLGHWRLDSSRVYVHDPVLPAGLSWLVRVARMSIFFALRWILGMPGVAHVCYEIESHSLVRSRRVCCGPGDVVCTLGSVRQDHSCG
ncbi:uncharacterized protein LAESUDRAFT_249894 [Laetiporus sulphureus 93-53]|uniref:Uncharacterized protein n=1 Tax=Laetiporus sulphureus 93-53 TaxID=1314785 RepID=A0A165DJ05_9APHY|nr:uncharacterized protein LAESUDRAFT_249894 [Laetiporus sulphureus 93-53]KZT04989.1 hypothetical protein LAESUDRAFT_249894 [Laetiporus sulphureus 93-53]